MASVLVQAVVSELAAPGTSLEDDSSALALAARGGGPAAKGGGGGGGGGAAGRRSSSSPELLALQFRIQKKLVLRGVLANLGGPAV